MALEGEEHWLCVAILVIDDLSPIILLFLQSEFMLFD